MWIRSPAWDGFWFLSGIPIGIALWLIAPPLSLGFYFILLFRVGHLAAPVACAWSHKGFRDLMLRQKVKFIVIPLLVFIASGTLSLLLLPTIDVDGLWLHIGHVLRPAAWLAALYVVGNQWHLGMQNFGVMRLYAVKAHISPSRVADKALCLSAMAFWSVGTATHFNFIPGGATNPALVIGVCAIVVAAAIAALAAERSWPRAMFILAVLSPVLISFWSYWYGFATVLLNHWLTAIGLSAHVDANHRSRSPLIFALAMMAAGAAVVLLRSHFKLILGANLGLSFVHYLYDRWLWKLSDPQVRATIGKDLLPGNYH